MARKTKPSVLTFEKPKRAEPKPPAPEQSSFFMAAMIVYYEREGSLKTRHMNMLLQLPAGAQLNKTVLASLNQKAVARITAENAVALDEVRDLVFLGISFLGIMTEEEFHGPEETAVDPMTVEPA